jgi:hypothetical protein
MGLSGSGREWSVPHHLQEFSTTRRSLGPVWAIETRKVMQNAQGLCIRFEVWKFRDPPDLLDASGFISDYVHPVDCHAS